MFDTSTLLNSFSPNFINNRIKLLSGYLNRKSISEGSPLELALEITNQCNANCIMCPRAKMKRKIGYMELSLLKQIAEEAKGRTELIFLHLAGEPLLHPQIFEMIKLCRKVGIKTAFSTNAVLLDEDMSKRLLESPPDLLTLSLDGTNKKTYEKIRKRTDYEMVLSNIQGFLKLKSKAKRPPYTIIQLIYMKENATEAEAFLSIWKRSQVDAARIKPFFNYPGLDEDLCALPKSQNEFRKPCILIWRQLTVYWDGTVVACCQDFLSQSVLGNLKENSLEEIWNGSLMQQMRMIHAQGRRDKIPLCRDCTMPKVNFPFLLASIFIDDLSIKKILPKIEELAIIKKIRQVSYFS